MAAKTAATTAWNADTPTPTQAASSAIPGCGETAPMTAAKTFPSTLKQLRTPSKIRHVPGTT